MNYQPGEAAGAHTDNVAYKTGPTPPQGSTRRIPFEKTHNFQQAGDVYRSFSKGEQTEWVKALAGDLIKGERRESSHHHRQLFV